MELLKSKINRIAFCAAIAIVGLFFVVSGIITLIKYTNAHDVYAESYKKYLQDDTAVKGELWCVEGCFAESADYTYSLIPITDKDTFMNQQDMKFVVYCFQNEELGEIQKLIDYWNGVLQEKPESIEFSGLLSPASDEISEGAYSYFEETYGFSKEEANEYYLPYVITDIGSFSYAYLPKIFVGMVFILLSAVLSYFLIIKAKKDENRVFTEADIPIFESKAQNNENSDEI